MNLASLDMESSSSEAPKFDNTYSYVGFYKVPIRLLPTSSKLYFSFQNRMKRNVGNALEAIKILLYVKRQNLGPDLHRGKMQDSHSQNTGWTYS
jgi:hypothetical protein